MRALLASPLGFLIGASLGTVGGGGSILAVPALVLAAGEHTRAATTTSLLVVGLASVFGAYSYWRMGNVRILPGVAFGLAGIGGSLAGSHLNSITNPNFLLLGFAGIMLVAAYRMYTQNVRQPKMATQITVGTQGGLTPGLSSLEVETTLDVRMALMIIAAGTAVGFLTGFFGVGGGFIIVPALVFVLGYSMPVAAGTSLLVIALNALVSFVPRIGTSSIDWKTAIPFTVLALVGTIVGSKLASKTNQVALAKWFVYLLVVVALAIGVRASVSI